MHQKLQEPFSTCKPEIGPRAGGAYTFQKLTAD